MPALKPKIRPDLEVVELDHEAVVYDPRLRNVHYLNHTAALVLGICDGSGTIRELSEDIADVYEMGVDEVESEVRKLLRGFRKLELLERPGVKPTRVRDSRERVRIQVPKSTWQDELDHLGWVVNQSYELDGLLFGIRTNSLEVGEWLLDTFAEYELADEHADPYFSVLIAEGGVGKRFHVLYKESRAMLRTHDLRELGQALLYELEALVLKRRQDAVYVEMAIVEKDGVSALVPSLYPAFLRTLGRRAERALTLPLAPVVAVDPATGGLLPIPQQLDVPPEALERLADLESPVERRELWQPPERTDLVLFFQWTGEGPDPVPVSRALALYSLARLAPNLHALGGLALQGLARLVAGAQCYQLQEAPPRELLEGIAAALSQRELVPA